MRLAALACGRLSSPCGEVYHPAAMLRKALLLLSLCIAVLASASSAFADGFNLQTQSHYGACSRETTNVKLAVHDYAANGVLADFAHLVGFHGSDGALAAKMRKYLVVAPVLSKVVTANHGCDDEGQWFPVGPRTLGKGELVGVKVPAKLRAHLCGRLHHSGCKRVVLSASLVFPITCWNPNMGNVKVVLYVHHKKKRKPKHHVKPKKEEAAPPPEEKPAPPPVVTTPAPAAAAAQRSCSEGDGVVVTLSNASTATAGASFTVNGVSYGPLAPGASQTVTIALNPGESTKLTVTSGSSTLINGQAFSDSCKAEPAATASIVGCIPLTDEETAGLEVEVTLSNGSHATLPASFSVEWAPPHLHTSGAEPITKSYGPLAPGIAETPFVIDVGVEEEEVEPFTLTSTTLTITSGGETILSKTFEQPEILEAYKGCYQAA